MKTRLLLCAVLVLATSCGKKETQDQPKAASNVTVTCEGEVFCLVATKSSGQIDFMLRTFPASEVTLTLGFEMTNLTPSVPLPLTMAVKGAGETPLITLASTEKGAGFSYKFDFDWGYGLNTAQHDDAAVYRMPYATGSSFEVVQGYDGEFSHTEQMRYAVDFGMPEGTPVHAARAGTVIDVVSKFAAGGTDPALKDQANTVRISHADGTVGQYLHFQKDGIAVKRGQAVLVGDLLGSSGNTGYTSGPHLHFEVHRRIDGETRASLPVTYSAEEGAGLTPEMGSSYTAKDL